MYGVQIQEPRGPLKWLTLFLMVTKYVGSTEETFLPSFLEVLCMYSTEKTFLLFCVLLEVLKNFEETVLIKVNSGTTVRTLSQ